MADVAARSTRGKLILFSDEELALKTVVAGLVLDGASLLRRPKKIGTKWVAILVPDATVW